MSRSSPTPPPPLPFHPMRPATPISFPIETLIDLATRSYFRSFHYPFNKSSLPLSSSAISQPDRPRLLVCHDMNGGYGDDKWPQGGTNPGAYSIWHWQMIDIFVYFSHSLVTLPPPGWINAAHRHGVKVLGTFITEWDKGMAICEQLLTTKESASEYAERLAELAYDLGFDGWLVNVENPVSNINVPILLHFLDHLTQTMHSLVPGSLVIWYDSITMNGDLKWQNRLNSVNRCYFDKCDGIFVNYSWKKEYPLLSAAEAGRRRYDVYMGIDVFGRNTFGGGQWNTSAALDLLKTNHVSTAVFAPGWIYETRQPPNFLTAQNIWWNMVKTSWGQRNGYITELPLYSNFDRGHGYHISVEGVVSARDWNNLSCQGYEPILEFVGIPHPLSFQAILDLNGPSYDGGGNTTFRGDIEDDDHYIVKLFEVNVVLSDSPLRVTFSLNSVGSSSVGLCFKLSSKAGDVSCICLAPTPTNDLSHRFSQVIVANQIKTHKNDSGWSLYEGVIHPNFETLKGIEAICYNAKSFSCVLGHVGVSNLADDVSFPLRICWVVEAENVDWSSGSDGSKIISLKIEWRLGNGNDAKFMKYNVYADSNGMKLMGVAYAQVFYVSDFSISSDASIIKFIIQPCAFHGVCQQLEDSPFLLVHVDPSSS